MEEMLGISKNENIFVEFSQSLGNMSAFAERVQKYKYAHDEQQQKNASSTKSRKVKNGTNRAPA